MNRPPFPSNPPSQPSPYRYLGRGGGERPVRLQIIIALVAGLILVAVPLYLWRRPRPEPIPSADAAVAATTMLPDAGSFAAPVPDAGAQGVQLTKFTTLKCENPGPGKTPPERCDHVATFEDNLARAIRDNARCAPPGVKTQFTVSYVMEADFRRKKLNVFAGKSSSLRREKARSELVRCIKRDLPSIDWGTMKHDYQRYKVNVVATYPPSTDSL